MERLIINTGSNVATGDGDIFRFALQQTEGNFNTLYDAEPFSKPFPFTGSAQIIASEGLIGATLGVTGSQDPGFAPSYSPSIEVNGPNYVSSSAKFVIRGNPNVNSDYFYISNLHKNDVDDESFIEILSTANRYFIKPSTFTCTIGNSTNTVEFNFSDNTNFIGNINGVNTNTPLIKFIGDGAGRMGINTSQVPSSMDLTINGGISASAYFASQIPSTDPEDSTKWFHANSDEVFGIPGSRILCKSQGPGPLITTGLKYMLSPEIAVTHLDPNANYVSPANSLNYYFSSSIRYGAQMPTASTWNAIGNSNYSITSNQLVNFSGTTLPRPLYYFNMQNSFTVSKRHNVRIDNTIFENGATDPSTLIFWWYIPQHTGTRTRYIAGCDASAFSISSKGSSFADPDGDEQLFFSFGGSIIEIPYWSPSFPVDVSDWVMFALNFSGGSGVVDYKMYFSGSTGGYQTQGQTSSGFDIDANNAFRIGLVDDYGTGIDGNPLSLSAFLYYSRSISEAEFTDIYHYFSGSHGYNQ